MRGGVLGGGGAGVFGARFHCNGTFLWGKLDGIDSTLLVLIGMADLCVGVMNLHNCWAINGLW